MKEKEKMQLEFWMLPDMTCVFGRCWKTSRVGAVTQLPIYLRRRRCFFRV